MVLIEKKSYSTRNKSNYNFNEKNFRYLFSTFKKKFLLKNEKSIRSICMEIT